VRVVVAADAVGALSSAEAGRALAQGWPAADTTVLPVGVAGAGFVRAAADLLEAAPATTAVDGAVVTEVRQGGTAVLLVEALP
jgi:glycerate kinase